MNNLAKDIQVSFDTVKSWLDVLETFYVIFRLSPFTHKLSRAITKEKKIFFYDYGQLEDPGAKFENMTALELMRAVYSWQERGFGKFSLCYLRTKDGEECDFVIVKGKAPWLLIECKVADTIPTKSLRKFQDLYQIPAVQLVNIDGIRRTIRNGSQEILVASASDWLASLP